MFAGILSPQAHAAQTFNVTNATELRNALNSAGPGDTISVAPGNYDGGFVTSRSGAPGAPIRLTAAPGGNRDNVKIKGTGIAKGSPYAFEIQNAGWWQVDNVGFENASKGVIIEQSHHVVLDHINVVYVGEEGVHFRKCSTDNELKGSVVRWTGRTDGGRGEGVYVGTAYNNWSQNGYGCSGGQDQSNNNSIHDNWIADTPAEGADLKEGTWGGQLYNNTFERTGSVLEVKTEPTSPGADSAIDVKGNYWSVRGNIIKEPQEHSNDAIQTHQQNGNSNTGNVFENNHILGTWRGFGIKLVAATASQNTVKCNNTVDSGTVLANVTCVS